MKLCIPVVGDTIELTAPVTLTLNNAGQNSTFVNACRTLWGDDLDESIKCIDIQLNKGSKLQVDRVYIRQGDGAEFNSLTVKFQGQKSPRLPKGRFFFSIDTAHQLDVKLIRPAPDTPLSLRKQLSKIWRELPVQQRIEQLTGDILAEQLKSVSPLWQGRVVANIPSWFTELKHRVDRHLETLPGSPLEGKDNLERKYNEEDARLIRQVLREQDTIIQQSPSAVPICDAQVYFHQNEMIIALSLLQDHEACIAAMAEFGHVVTAWECLFFANGIKYSRLSGDNAPQNLIISSGFSRFRMGRYYNTNSSKSLICCHNNAKGFILSDGYRYNVLTDQTTDTPHYAYQEQNGQVLSIKEFRRYLAQLKKTNHGIIIL